MNNKQKYNIMSVVEEMKSDIEKINDFATTFSQKTQNIEQNVNAVIEKLNNIIKIEKNNESFLLALNTSLSDIELENKIQDIQQKQQTISEKQKEYLSIIENNAKNIHKIKQDIDKKQDKIQQIFDGVDNLEKSMSLLNTK